VVWIPKYRRRVLQGAVAARLTELLRQGCEVNRWRLHELNVQPDHVHLLIQISPDERLSDVLHRLKGGTSRLLRAEFPELEEFLWGRNFWGRNFWADGYFAETVGLVEEAVVRRYIQNQARSLREPNPGAKPQENRGAHKPV
jgi:putative transposase